MKIFKNSAGWNVTPNNVIVTTFIESELNVLLYKNTKHNAPSPAKHNIGANNLYDFVVILETKNIATNPTAIKNNCDLKKWYGLSFPYLKTDEILDASNIKNAPNTAKIIVTINNGLLIYLSLLVFLFFIIKFII